MAAALFFVTHHVKLFPTLYATTLWKECVKQEPFKEAAGTLHEDPRHFMQRWGQQFADTGSVLTKKRKVVRAKPGSIPHDEAFLAAVYLKTGYWKPVQFRHSSTTRYVHRYYQTVPRACRLCPELKAIRDKYKLTNKQLYNAMKAADPNLARHTVRIKYGFTKAELHNRVQRATSLFDRCDHEPDWRDRTYFVDECGIWIDSEATKGSRVYCDAHDKGYQSVIHYEQLPKSTKIKVRFVAAVNPVHGAVYLEFTTGTTNIRRVHNMLPTNPQHGPYKVSLRVCSLLADDNAAVSSSVNPKPRQLLQQQLRVRADNAFAIEVHSVVATGQYDAGASRCALYGCPKVLWLGAAAQLLLMYPHHAHTCPHSLHTEAHIICQLLSCGLSMHALKVAAAISL